MKIAVAVVTAIIVAPATYFINDFLARDRVSVAAVEFEPSYTEYILDTSPLLENYESKYAYSEFKNWTRTQTIKLSDLLENRDGKSLNKSERELLATSLEKFVAYIEGTAKEIDGLKAEFEKYPENPLARAELLRRASELDVKYRLPPDQLSQSAALAAANSRQAALKKSAEVASKMAVELKTFVPARTGDLAIHVTFLNSGNTDGVVKPEGHLSILDRTERLVIHEFDWKAIKVEKRAVADAWFAIDSGTSNPQEIAELSTLVKNRSPVFGKVEFSDYRGQSVTSNKQQVPASDAGRRGDS